MFGFRFLPNGTLNFPLVLTQVSDLDFEVEFIA